MHIPSCSYEMDAKEMNWMDMANAWEWESFKRQNEICLLS